MVALYWFKPWESPAAALVSGVWLLAGWMAVSYSFLFPHFYISKAIRAEKYRQMAELQKILASYQARLEKLSEDELKKLSELISLYDRLAAARETSLDIQALSSFFTSLVLPTLSFLGGLVDIKKLVGLP